MLDTINSCVRVTEEIIKKFMRVDPWNLASDGEFRFYHEITNLLDNSKRVKGCIFGDIQHVSYPQLPVSVISYHL